MAVYTPVIRLPPKRKPSLIRNHGNSGSNTSNSSHGSPNELSLDPNDCLVSDTLYLSKLPANIRESDIRTLLQHCMPIEIFIDREKDIGQLRFSQAKYADRAYSLYNGFTFTNNTKLELQMYQDKRLDPEAKAALLEINGLPEHFDDNKLYDVFRPFGPLNLCKCVMKDGAFRGTAFVQFFNAYSSNEAVAQMDDHSLDGYRLSVVPFMPSKTHASQQQHQQQHHQHQEESLNNHSAQNNNNNSSSEDPNSVDFMNLYIKNLEPHITNHDLNQTFRKFGRIISARVMTNPATGQSKGYGFVSFGKSEEAAAALKEMNGAMLGNRPLTVAYHEPRKGRPNTVNYNNNHNSNNHHYQQQQQQQQQQHQQHEYQQHSYYNSNNNSMERSNNLSSSTPINGLGIDNVDELGMNMNLKDLSIGQKPATLHAATVNLPPSRSQQQHHQPPKLSPQFSSSPMSGASTGRSLASLASGLSIQQPPPTQQQQHPIVHIGHNGRPTLRRRGSLESVMTESSANLQRIKLEDAVRQCGDYGKATADIVDMLLTLKRKERSLCLFNPDFLHEKVQLALEALATCNETDSEEDDDDDDDEDQDGLEMEYALRNHKKPTSPPATTPSAQPYYSPIQRNVIPSPPIPTARRESKAIPIIAPPAKPTSVTNTSSSSASSSTVIKEEVKSMLLSFEGKPIHEKKQLLGDKLFPLVKSTGTKQAPKVTIHLLDTVDLHELANIMFDTPLLKNRVEDAFNALQQQQH